MKKAKVLPKWVTRRFDPKKIAEVPNHNWGTSILFKVKRPFRVWKKVVPDGQTRAVYIVIPLTLPKGALFWMHAGSGKCRASKVISQGDGYSSRGNLRYKKGVRALPDRFYKRDSSICSNGIHFFPSRSAAQRYAWS